MSDSVSLRRALLDRGVGMSDPTQVFVAPDVDPSRIAEGVVLHPGTRLEGEKLSIGPGCIISAETPATVRDCALGERVTLGGGFFHGSVFLDDVEVGSSAHLRPGCLLEEQVTLAHAVGLKQTILLPFVTVGSLVNLCDCLVAGGTSRSAHSEIGSSFVHFNFTPHGDKATPSLVGDVAHGVLLDQPPIFLGGQGGMVGPVRVDYGTVWPAGGVVRHHLEPAGQLHRPPPATERAPRPWRTGEVVDLDDRVARNLRYLGELAALKAWYRRSRSPVMQGSPHGSFCLAAALQALDLIAHDRMKWLRRLGTWPSRTPSCWPERVGPTMDHWEAAWREAAFEGEEDLPPGEGADGLLWVRELDHEQRQRIRAALAKMVASVQASLPETETASHG